MVLSSINLFQFSSIILLTAYGLLLMYTVFRILMDTHSTPKTLAYLLLAITIPIAGILLYFSFGINYRHNKTTRKGIAAQKEFSETYWKNILDNTQDLRKAYSKSLNQYTELVQFIYKLGGEKLVEMIISCWLTGKKNFRRC